MKAIITQSELITTNTGLLFNRDISKNTRSTFYYQIKGLKINYIVELNVIYYIGNAFEEN